MVEERDGVGRQMMMGLGVWSDRMNCRVGGTSDVV